MGEPVAGRYGLGESFAEAMRRVRESAKKPTYVSVMR